MCCRFFCFIVIMALDIPVLYAGASNSLLDISPDGKLLLAANRDNDTVTVVETATLKVLREIKVVRKPEGVSWIAPAACRGDIVRRQRARVF